MAWTYIGPATVGAAPTAPSIAPTDTPTPATAPTQTTLQYAQPPAPFPGLDPELVPIVKRESGGKPFVGYTPPGQPLVDLSKAPLDETGFPIWEGNVDPATGRKSHAAGIAQIQPDTWAPIAKKLGIHDFSVESQIAVANELRKQQGLTPWRASDPSWAVTSAGKWKVAPESIAFEQNQPNTTVIWMAPDDYKSMVQKGEEPEDRPKSRSLERSLALGDHIEQLPELTVKDGRITDQDGWRRAQAAIDAGVTLIPVAVRGVTPDTSTITDMRGQVRPFNFKEVPRVERPTTLTGMPGLATVKGPPSSIPTTFPYDAPGVTYGSVLPVAMNEQTHEIAPAVPEMIRAPVRGAIEIGARAMGFGEEGQNPLRPLSRDSLSALLAAVGTPALGGRIPSPGLAARAPIDPVAPPPTNMMSSAGTAFMKDLRSLTKRENAARAVINRTAARDLIAGGATGQQMAAEMAAGARENQPLSLVDVGGENIRSLLGNLAREPGPARERVKLWAINRLGDIDRDSPISTAIEGGIDKYLATGSARTEAKALAEQRSASKPLWDEAMRGGSIAPLRTQLEQAYSDADRLVRETERDITRINQEVTATAARQSQAGNVYSASGSNRARRFADDKIVEKKRILEQAERDKADAREMMRKAQEDDAANAPGAVWSPYIGRLLKNPNVAQGIRRGWNIERDIADGENRPFNPREYAVVGEDANGDPIVGTVPNMKLLAVAKEGMDAMLDSPAFKDELTGRLNKAGRALKILRDGMLSEVDRLNPAYKPARDKWAGDSALIANIRDGKNFHKQSPEEIAEHFTSASESEKEAYRIGAADTLRDDLQKRVFAGDPSKAIINSPRSRQQLLPMFPSTEQAIAFLDRVKRARTMFNTPVEVLRGSPTAAREAEDMARREGLDTAVNAIHAILSPRYGMVNTLRHFGKNMISPPDKALNDTVARLLLDPQTHINPGMELLQKAPLPAVQGLLSSSAAMRRAAVVNSLQRYGQRFMSQGPLP